ncbi:MAG: threonine synthase, partial [Proteiniphilum sp.]
MLYYSTQKQSSSVSLKEAVVKGLAPDRGLYMPETIRQLPASFYNEITGMSLTTIAQTVARTYFGEDIPKRELDAIVADSLIFEIP